MQQINNRSILYKLRAILTVSAVILSALYQLFFDPPFCPYCSATRYAFIALSLHYLLSNSLLGLVKWKTYERIVESFLIIFCFSISTVALLAKYGILSRWISLCSSIPSRGCLVSYPASSFLELKVLAFATATIILLLKLVDSFLLK